MGAPSAPWTSYFDVIVRIRSLSRNASRSNAGSPPTLTRGSEPTRRGRLQTTHSTSRPAYSGLSSYTSPQAHATTIPLITAGLDSTAPAKASPGRPSAGDPRPQTVGADFVTV